MPEPRTRKYVLLLMLLHLGIALPLAWTLNIWADEASSLYTTQQGIAFAISNAGAIEKQAPLYFWLLSLWRLVSDSIFFARIPSIIFSLASICVAYSLAKKLIGCRAAVTAAAVIALHPFMIWASLEIRVYSAIVLLALLLTWFFCGAYLSDVGDKAGRSRTWFTITAAVALYTNFYLGFLLVGFFTALLILRRWPQAASYLLSMVIVAVAFAPLVFAMRGTFGSEIGQYHEPVSLLEGVRNLWSNIVTYLMPAELFPAEDPSAFAVFRTWFVRIAIVGLGLFALIRRPKLGTAMIAFGIVVAVSCLFYLAAYMLTGPQYLQIRHTAAIFAPLVLFTIAFIRDILCEVSQGMRKVTVAIAEIVLLVSFSYGIETLYPAMVKRGDWERVAAYLVNNESPGQPIVIFTPYDAISLPYYYQGRNKVLPDGRYFDFAAEAEFGSPDSLRSQIDFVISEIPADANEVWLVVNEKCLATRACEPLENFVDSHYTVVRDERFYLERLRLLRKKPQ